MKKKPLVKRFPPGWDHKKAARVAAYYDRQSEDEIVGEIEALALKRDSVLVQIPRQILPQVLELIEDRKKSA